MKNLFKNNFFKFNIVPEWKFVKISSFKLGFFSIVYTKNIPYLDFLKTNNSLYLIFHKFNKTHEECVFNSKITLYFDW